jgi:hypothetical protein
MLNNIRKQEKMDAVAVGEMLGTKGWTVIDKELAVEISNLTGQLIKEDDPAKAQVIRADLRALQKFIEKIGKYATD